MAEPVVASYCTTFLKPEMLHIYRQVANLRRWKTFVVTADRQNADQFPFDPVDTLPRPRVNPLRRAWLKYLKRAPKLVYRGEYDALANLLARRNAALLHVYFGHTGVHLLPFIEAWPHPAIVSFHGVDARIRADSPGYASRLARLFTMARLILARSNALASRIEALGCPRGKIRLNHTGIPMDAFPFTQRTAPADGEWRVIQACRLIEKKGLPIALRAFARLAARHPKARFIIAGEGPLRPALEVEARSLGILDKIEFPGFLDQTALAALYRNSHIFLHPSLTTGDNDQEGIPNSMLEAMATGLPIVSTFHSGIPEAVDNGESGILVPEQDDEGASRALLQLADNPNLWTQMSRAAARVVRERFELSQQIAVLENCYSEAVSSG